MRWPARISLALFLVVVSGLATAASASAFAGFVSPTRNIGCVMDKGGVRCDIRNHSWKSPPKPKWCDVDYGGGVAVDKKGKAGIVCAGDTTLESGPVLAYGHSISRGRFSCESQEAGMRCVNKRNGHGFFLSKQSYQLF